MEPWQACCLFPRLDGTSDEQQWKQKPKQQQQQHKPKQESASPKRPAAVLLASGRLSFSGCVNKCFVEPLVRTFESAKVCEFFQRMFKPDVLSLDSFFRLAMTWKDAVFVICGLFKLVKFCLVVVLEWAL